MAAKLQSVYEKAIVEHRQAIAKLAVEIARKILAQKVKDGDYQIESIIQEALNNAPTRQDIVVRLNPQDLARCQQMQQQGDGAVAGVKFVADPGIGPAQCVVETPKGKVESLIDEHLEQVAGRALMQGSDETMTRETTISYEEFAVDFDRLHSALETINLMDCQGTVVKVSGIAVESTGPTLGLGELCGIHIRDGRRIMAEVVGFQNDHLILLPLEHIEGISPGDAVTARTTPRHINLSEGILGKGAQRAG